MSSSRVVRLRVEILLLFIVANVVTETSCQCTPVCESYHFSTFPASIDSGIVQSFVLSINNSWLQLRGSEVNVTLQNSETCANAAASCRLLVDDNGGGNLTGNFTCSDLEGLRGRNVVLVFEMEAQTNESRCRIIMQSFVFEQTSSVTQLTAELMSDNICIVTLEGCFPPCCGSTGIITRVAFGSIRYRPQVMELCKKIYLSMSNGDSSTIYYDNLLPSLILEESQNSTIDLSLVNSDLDNLQNCFKTCTRTIDIGRGLTSLNYTKGCFSVNATLSPPEEVMDHTILLKSYKANFTYCTERQSGRVIHIDCVGFNPEDSVVHERIVLEISHSGVCIDTYSLKFGTPETVPCMDRRCQKVASFNIDLCLTLCIDNVSADEDTVPLCENVAKYALHQSPLLTNDNVTVVLDVLGALANTSGPRQIEAFNIIIDDLLTELQKDENIHLLSQETGNMLMAVFDTVLRDSDANSTAVKVELAPVLHQNLENLVKGVARAVRQDILSPNFEYTGNHAIVFASVSLIQHRGDYLFPPPGRSEHVSGVKLRIPSDVLCKRFTPLSECESVVVSVITKNLPQYLDEGSTHNEKVVNSLLLSTLIDSSVDYKYRIMQEPVTIHFTPVPLNSNFSNETCVFWDPVSRMWSSTGVVTSGTAKLDGETTCIATHLTSFAVLVNPKSSERTTEIKALGIVSYVGCAISLACLLASLLIFLTFGKSLNKGVLLYIHINFCVSLSLALAVFVIGIESATHYAWLCKAIAALLHYLFLCVFCWMLAEGIMLYVLVVRVFGSVPDKWYYLLLLGWGLPLPVVAVSLGIRHDGYGTEKYCWLSSSNGTFWAFLGPMIIIIMVNTIILVLTVGNMIRSRRKFIGSKDSRNWRLVLTAVKSTFILLPLLGLAWIIGPFSLFSGASVLSWVFAILNSLQGLFFFILHVLRNDKVYDSIKKCLRCIPAAVMEKPYTLRGLSSNITLASAESVATTSTTEGMSQFDCERVGSPPFNVRIIYQRKSSEGSAVSLSHPTVSVYD